MAGQRHYYLLRSTFPPAEVFRILRETCEDKRQRDHDAAFEFDWLKRRLEISAKSAESAQVVLNLFLARIRKRVGDGLMLPGEPMVRGDGRHGIPIGVLMQTPDIYAELLVSTLIEMGVGGIRSEEDGDGFSVPLSAKATGLAYREVLEEFPLPAYIKLIDNGIR